MAMNSDEINTGGSAFWIFITLVSLLSLVFIMIWSYNAKSAQGAILALIFFAMIVSSTLFSRLRIFDWASWGDNTLSFTIGFIIWMVIGSISSLSVVSQNHLFAAISSELPIILELSTTVFLIPIAEEMFWMIGLPFALTSIMNIAGNRFSFAKQAWFQIPVIVLIGALSFAFFHVGNTAFIAFIIVAMIFRSIMLFFVYAEHHYNIFKKINLVAGFAIGAHIANNLLAFGIKTSWLTMTSNFWFVGFFILAFLAIMFVSAIDRIFELFESGGHKDQIRSLKN